MSEILLGNTKQDCELPSGIVEWYISSFKNVDSVTIASNEVAAITMVATKKFLPIKIDPETSTFTDTGSGELTAGVKRTQSATIVLKGYTVDDDRFLTEIESGRVMLIAKRSDGTFVLLFRENGGKAVSTIDAGTAFDSFNGSTTLITGVSISKAVHVQSSVIATII